MMEFLHTTNTSGADSTDFSEVTHSEQINTALKADFQTTVPDTVPGWGNSETENETPGIVQHQEAYFCLFAFLQEL